MAHLINSTARFGGLLLGGPGWSQTYPLSPNPAVVESHEFRKPLLIEVEQQHQVQAGIHQLVLQLRSEKKALQFIYKIFMEGNKAKR